MPVSTKKRDESLDLPAIDDRRGWEKLAASLPRASGDAILRETDAQQLRLTKQVELARAANEHEIQSNETPSQRTVTILTEQLTEWATKGTDENFVAKIGPFQCTPREQLQAAETALQVFTRKADKIRGERREALAQPWEQVRRGLRRAIVQRTLDLKEAWDAEAAFAEAERMAGVVDGCNYMCRPKFNAAAAPRTAARSEISAKGSVFPR